MKFTDEFEFTVRGTCLGNRGHVVVGTAVLLEESRGGFYGTIRESGDWGSCDHTNLWEIEVWCEDCRCFMPPEHIDQHYAFETVEGRW